MGVAGVLWNGRGEEFRWGAWLLVSVTEHPAPALAATARADATGIGATGPLAAAAIVATTLWLAYPPTSVLYLASSHAVNRWTVPAAIPILIGCLVACLMWKNTLPPAISCALGVFGALTFLLPLAPYAHALVPAALHLPLSSSAIAPMMAFLMGSPRARAVKALELWLPAYLGTISYGIYVWQGILTGNGSYRQVPGWPPEPLLGAMLAVALAALSYRFFEEPILRYKDRLGRSARPEV